jgi:hypothetical protein
MSRSSETAAPISIEEDRKIKLPAKTLIAIIVCTAAAVASWSSIKGDVSGNTKDISDLRDETRAIRTEQQVQRELLIRIDSKLEVKR